MIRQHTAPDEHDWHACDTPAPLINIEHASWTCPTCHQRWLWRRPPRPTATWIRAQHDEPNRS